MNPWLAQMYNTNGAAEEAQEEQSKLANADLFCKLAADNNIDLEQLSADEVGALYANTFPEDVEKVAQETCDKCDKAEGECSCGSGDESSEDEKKEAAAQYVMAKQAETEKAAEADLMGRIMAHSFTQELENIKEAGAKELFGKGVDVAKKVGGKAKDVAKGLAEKRRYAMEVGKKHEGIIRGKGGLGMGKGVKAKATVIGRALKGRAAQAAPYAAGAGAVGGGAYIAKKKMEDKEKKSSVEAFEEMSANHAIKLAAAMDWNEEEAFDRVNSVFTLGLQETEKVAHVQDVDSAMHVRGLEYLEAAGYPVDWTEVFGEE
jgi:hypothetical protein